MTPYFADEWVTLYHGDALAVMANLPERSVDTVLTDPPYSSGGRRENSRTVRHSMTRRVADDDWIRGDAMSTQGYVWFNRLAALEYRRLLVPGGHAFSFADWRMAPLLSAAFETADLRIHPTIVWDKTYFGMGAIFRNQHEFIVHGSAGNPRPPQRRDVGNVIACKPIDDDRHPSRKPVGVLDVLITTVASPGGAVLDCMAGSGSTAEAARMSGRTAVLIEADERYCELIARRMSQGVLAMDGAS